MLSPNPSQDLPLSDQYLDSEQFYARFKEFHAQLRTSFWKVERRQEYLEPGDQSLGTYLSGDKHKAADLVRQDLYNGGWSPYALHRARENIPMVRIRLVEIPLTPYLEWEFLTYQVSAMFGERILVVDLSNHDRTAPIAKGRDFLMFDMKKALIHNYEPDGLLRGAWLLEDSEKIRCYRDYFQICLASAVPLGSFLAKHKLPLL